MKGFQVSANAITFSFVAFVTISLIGHFTEFHVPQGITGTLGDPGLPGPTGVRGEFGERVSWLGRHISHSVSLQTSKDVNVEAISP